MIKKLLCFSMILIGLIFMLNSCAPPRPSDYSAVIVSKMGPMRSTSRMYFAGKKWRMETEQAGMKSAMIVREDKNVIWVLMPNKTYMEEKLSPEYVRGIATKMPGEMKREKIGKETVNGIPCTKYKITYKATKTSQPQEMYQWISTDMIPIKSAAIDGSWYTEIKSIKRGKQPSSLFDLPKGYKKFKMPGM